VLELNGNGGKNKKLKTETVKKKVNKDLQVESLPLAKPLIILSSPNILPYSRLNTFPKRKRSEKT